ncbi:MAG: site-specific integrase, partial [Betaproteobacteria bacterium]
MSASTLAKELGLLSSVFKVAHAEWGMDDLVNPVTGIMRPRQPPGRNRRLLPGEEQALLAAFEEGPESDQSTLSATLNPFVRPVLILAIETGM